MKTIDCSTLATLVRDHQGLDLIDVRPKSEFAAIHIPGAQSIPLAQLVQPRISWQKPSARARVYVIANDVPCASLASGSLRGSGVCDVVAIEGGMPAWIQQGFPVQRAKSGLIALSLSVAAITLGVLGGIAFALDRIVPSVFALLSAGLLVSIIRVSLPISHAGTSRRRSKKARAAFIASRTPPDISGILRTEYMPELLACRHS